MNSIQDRWLVPITPRRLSGVRLVCFPYAGAGASIYRSWSKFCPVEFECFAIQPPGRETRFADELIANVTNYAESAAQAIHTLPADRPLVLFGHSLGALAAYETALNLSLMGRPVDHLIVSGRQDPSTPSKREPIAHLSDAAFVKQMATYNGTPAEVIANRDLLELLLPMIKNDFAMSENYAARSSLKLACPVMAIGSLEDSWLDAESLEQWKDVTSGDFDMKWFSGDHFYLNHQTADLVQFLHKYVSF